MDISTKVGSVTLATPLMLASGYITETPEFFLAAQQFGCAALVTRSLKKNIPPERSRVPAPRYAVFGERSMLNCEWGNEKPWKDWLETGVKTVHEIGSPIVISLSGRDLPGCVELIEHFDTVGVDAYEINVSCSHSGALHGNLNVDVDHLRNVLGTLRPRTRKPIWIKLSYSTELIPMARIAVDLGADAIVCTNGIGPGMLIDTSTKKSKVGISGGGGGVTGAAIFPIALWCVSQLSRSVRVPIVGCGGVFSGDEAIQMLMAGASALQLYTLPALQGPRSFDRVRSGILRYFGEHPEYRGIADIVGLVSRADLGHQFSSPKPEVLVDRCTGCGICIQSCAFDALRMASSASGMVAEVLPNCIACNACAGVCPPKWDAIKTHF